MGIGTSRGAFYDSDGHFQASLHDRKYDTNDDMVLTPNEVETNKGLYQSEMDNLGIEVKNTKDKMPFPDNRNPDSDFNSRFGNLPPSGILNDLKKPTGETVPLVRKISDNVGEQERQRVLKELKDPKEVDKALDIGLAFTGGGLHTAGERVGRAALKFGDEIFTGVNHGDALDKILAKGIDFDYKKILDGFITTHGRFVSRAEALDIAEQAKQVYKKHEKIPGFELSSEELLRGR